MFVKKTAFLPIIGIFIFSCTACINSHLMPDLFLDMGLSSEDIDDLSKTQILGDIIAGFVLSQCINIVNKKVIAIGSVLMVLMNTLSLMLVTSFSFYVTANVIIIEACFFSYIAVSIIAILQNARTTHFAVTIFILAWVMGYLSAEYIVHSLMPINDIFLVNILLYAFIIMLLLPYKESAIRGKISNSQFSFLIENIELQILTGFMVTYIALDILWCYEAYALVKNLAITDTWLVTFLMMQSVFFFILPVDMLLSRVNKYFANLLLITLLLTCFILLPIYGKTLIPNLCLISIIGLCLCSIFVCNILILHDKFERYDFNTALLIYFSMCAIGMYIGAASSNVYYESTVERGFLLPIFCIVIAFILYYLWYLVRRGLYRW